MSFLGSIILQSAFLWLPVVLYFVFWDMWIAWRQGIYRLNQKWALLEINIPKDVFKSPEAMEIVFNILNDTGGVGTWWVKNVRGAVPHVSSLEIVSIEGSIYFFIRTQERFKDLLKNQIYSQYPQAEVNEVDDYARYIGDYGKKQNEWQLFGYEFGLVGPNFLPIKTYVDYGLDRAVGSLEEFEKVDPITAMLEYLGSMRAGEQVWIQLVIRGDKWTTWRKDGQEEIYKMIGRSTDGADANPEKPATTLRLSSGEQEKIKAIERTFQKPAFEVGFRALYLAKKDSFRPINIAGLAASLRQYNSPHLNGFKPTLVTAFDYKYQDISGTRLPALKRKFFYNYVNRAFFYDDVLYDSGEGEKKFLFFRQSPKKKTFVLSSEELATIFRIPGRVSETVSLERIEATKSEAPANLPV